MGGCGTRAYRNISRDKIDMALAALKKFGATIIGNNPWKVDTHYYGVKIGAKWDPITQRVDLTVTDSDGSIPCSLIWSFLDNVVTKYGK